MKIKNWFKKNKAFIIGYSLGYWSLQIIMGNTRDVSFYGWALLGWVVTFFIFYALKTWWEIRETNKNDN